MGAIAKKQRKSHKVKFHKKKKDKTIGPRGEPKSQKLKTHLCECLHENLGKKPLRVGGKGLGKNPGNCHKTGGQP